MQPGDLGERSIVTGDLEQCLATLKHVEAAGIAGTGRPQRARQVQGQVQGPANITRVFRVDGASPAVKLEIMLTPWMGTWVTPRTTSGWARPRHSSTVGTTSIAWWYWCRSSPRAEMPAGQEMMHGSQVPPLNE